MDNKISIVLISYNDQRNIENAINSVIKQTLKEIELICIDDASSDETPAIIQKYCLLDKRIKFYPQKENKGALYSRYLGTTHVTSKYVMFLDSDDTLTNEACQTAYDEITNKDSDLLLFGCNPNIADEVENKEEYKNAINFVNSIFNNDELPIFKSKNELLNYSFKEEKLPWTFWSKIYDIDLIRKAFKHYNKEKISFAEDVYFSFLVLYYCKTIYKINNKLYNYQIGSGKSTSEQRKIINEDNDINYVANSYLSYLLIKEHFYLENIDIKNIAESLNVVEEKAIKMIMNYFYLECTPSCVSNLYKTINKYISKDRLDNYLCTYGKEYYYVNKTKVLENINGCIFVDKKIKRQLNNIDKPLYKLVDKIKRHL